MSFNKNDFLLLLNNGFSLFFESLDNPATHITWPSEEDPAELCHPPPLCGSFKHNVGMEGLDKANSRKLMWGSPEHNSHNKYCD